MRILIDTNVLIDYLAERQPFFPYAQQIIHACETELLEGCISAQSIADIFYILRRNINEKERRKILLALCDIFAVVGLNQQQIVAALKNDMFTDFEDCLQASCAKAFHAVHIITRNVTDFELSEIPAISPESFCHQFLS